MSVQKLPTVEETKNWLREHSLTRQWLADEIAANKRSIDNWFIADALPAWAAKHIGRIMAERKQPRLTFTETDWDRIEKAKLLAGYKDRQDFFLDAITSWAEKLITDSDKPKITPFPLPADTDTARVAEDSPDYKFNPKPDTTK